MTEIIQPGELACFPLTLLTLANVTFSLLAHAALEGGNDDVCQQRHKTTMAAPSAEVTWHGYFDHFASMNGRRDNFNFKGEFFCFCLLCSLVV